MKLEWKERWDAFARQNFISVIKISFGFKQLFFSGIMFHPKTCIYLEHGSFAAWLELKAIHHSFPLFLEGSCVCVRGVFFLKIKVSDIYKDPHLPRHIWVMKIMRKFYPIFWHKRVSSKNYRVWALCIYFICGAKTTLGTEMTRFFFKAHQITFHHLLSVLMNQGGSRLLEAGQCDVHPQEGGSGKLQAYQPDLDGWQAYWIDRLECNHTASTRWPRDRTQPEWV